MRGDNKAYKHLYDAHYVLLCRVAFTFLRDTFLAQALVDDLIINLYEKRERLLITTSLRSYLVRAVRNRCLNYLQLEHERREVQLSSMPAPDDWLFSIATSNDYPLATLLENELEQEISSAVGRLPEECRAVFEKSRYEDKSYEAIAAEMSISVNTVKYHIKNALGKLRKELEGYLRGER